MTVFAVCCSISLKMCVPSISEQCMSSNHGEIVSDNRITWTFLIEKNIIHSGCSILLSKKLHFWREKQALVYFSLLLYCFCFYRLFVWFEHNEQRSKLQKPHRNTQNHKKKGNKRATSSHWVCVGCKNMFDWPCFECTPPQSDLEMQSFCG